MNPAALSAAAKGNLENFLVASTPGGIEAQEKRGQQGLVRNQLLPSEMSKEDRATLEAADFSFGNVVDGIFIETAFPEGWSKVATEHDMWSRLVDHKGRTRGGIFYKAAFYDRRAFMRLDCRYGCAELFVSETGNVVEDYNAPKRCWAAKDCESVISQFEPFPKDDWKARDEARNTVMEWLAENYPEWTNPASYWD